MGRGKGNTSWASGNKEIVCLVLLGELQDCKFYQGNVILKANSSAQLTCSLCSAPAEQGLQTGAGRTLASSQDPILESSRAETTVL